MKEIKIRYSKDALKFLSRLDKKSVSRIREAIAWDPDFTKVTAEEAKRIADAENSGYVDADEIDWCNIGIDAESEEEFGMSEKEIAMILLESVPSYKLGYVIAYLQGLMADDASDDAFCESLCAEYENDADKGQFVSMAEMAKMSGVDLNEI